MSSNEYNSDSDYDIVSEDNYSDIVYEPEEISRSRFCIALCDLHNVKIHGPGPVGHYLVNCRYKILHMDWITETADFIHIEYQILHSYQHDLYPNYRNIVLQENYIKPEFVECIHIDGCLVAIIKTFWLRIVQRAWKKQYAKRQSIIRSRGHIASQRHFELTGTYPRDIRTIPGLRGLLV